MTIITFLFTMVGAVGERYRTIAFGTLVVAIYTTLTYIPDNSASWFINPVMIFIRHFALQCSDYHCLSLFPNRPVQESVAKAFLCLRQLFRCQIRIF